MKKNLTPHKLLLAFTVIHAVFAFSYLSAQKFELPRDVIEGYVGWAGNPDTVTVHIEDTFTAAEKDSVRVAINRWNAAGCKPALKEVSSAPANIVITEGDPGDGNAGVYDWETDADGKVTKGKITIRNNPIPGLVETATHELGHALGLDDVDHEANPGDVMKGNGPSNGTNGNLSQHDSTELKAAMASVTPIANPADRNKKRALAPNNAMLPGQTSNLLFDLGQVYPPATLIQVTPVDDPLVNVNFSVFEGNTLFVSVTVLPPHGSGKFYLNIHILPPLPIPSKTIIGYHFVHITPVPPISFNCPMEIYQDEAGRVHVHWKDLHTYPLPNPLRGMLVVDGFKHYLTRNDLTLDLPAGPHLFELFVHDFQVNSAYSALDFEVTTPPMAINPASDPFILPCAVVQFGSGGDYDPIPSGFFNPGSEPFNGVVRLGGQLSQNGQLPVPDMVINRPLGVEFTGPLPSTATIPIELVALHLRSIEPIMVTTPGNPGIDSFFDVFVTIQSPSPGLMNLTRTEIREGTFELDLPVHPVFTFVNTADPDHIVFYDPQLHGQPSLNFSTTMPQRWIAPPIPGEFDPLPSGLISLQSENTASMSAAPLLQRNDNFTMEMDLDSQVVTSSGSGYNNGAWYYYPNTNWWNVWFYDHPFDANRQKIISGSINIQPRHIASPASAEVVLNWSTPLWPGFPGTLRPPLPADVPTPAIEALNIMRSEPLFIGTVGPTGVQINIADYIIEGYNPEWLSVDVRGSNLNITGTLNHVCFKPETCPPEPQSPSGYELRVGPWLIAEPWHQWIDGRPGETTHLQLHVHDPDNQIVQVGFEYNFNNQGWTLFDIDMDGEECTASPHVNCSDLADGWSGYFIAPFFGQSAEIQFRANVLLYNGFEFYVDSFFDVFVDITPPSSVEINLIDETILLEDNFYLHIIPVDANIDLVNIVIETKKNEFQKGIDTLSQKRHWRSGYEEGGDNHCVPTSAAACLKYFSDSASDNSIMGGLTPDQLVDSLAKLAKTNVGTWGTYYSKMASALRKWIKDHGDNYTVRGPIPYDWRTMRNELERSQDVLQGIRWPDGSGHMMTFNSIVNTPLPNGKIRVDFMDPWSGKIEYGDLDTISGQVTNYTNDSVSGRLDWTIIVCPKEPAPVKPGGQILHGPEPSPILLNFPNEGMYWIRTEILDLDGNKARFDKFVQRVFTEQNIDGTIPAGSTLCYDGYDVYKTGGLPGYIVDEDASVRIIARKRVELHEYTHFRAGSEVLIKISDESCNDMESEEELIADQVINANEPELKTMLNVYPNPSTGIFTIEFNTEESVEPVILEVFSMVGERLVSAELAKGSAYQLDISAKPKGIYIVRAIHGDSMSTVKIIKQ